MADWTTPVTTFSSVTLTSSSQNGTAIDLRRVLTDHAVQVTITWAVNDMWLVGMQGSLDGTDWFDLGNVAVNGGPPAASAGSATTLTVFSLKPARFLRAHGENLSTGSPSATVYVSSRE